MRLRLRNPDRRGALEAFVQPSERPENDFAAFDGEVAFVGAGERVHENDAAVDFRDVNKGVRKSAARADVADVGSPVVIKNLGVVGTGTPISFAASTRSFLTLRVKVF